MSNEWLKQLNDALVERRLDVTEVDGTLNVSQGVGISAHKTNIDPSALFDRLEGADAPERLIAGYANGVKGVLMEPKRSRATEWTFEKTAGRLMPNLEVDTFALGVEAATSGDPAFVQPFLDDLVIAFYIELDLGMRVLTQSQFDGWTATPERIYSGARSMLFHRTRETPWKHWEEAPQLKYIARSDSYDAARCLVFADAYFTELQDDLRFSLPSQDTFLFSPDGEDLDALKAQTQRIHAEAETPLSTRLFAFSNGRPVPAEH